MTEYAIRRDGLYLTERSHWESDPRQAYRFASMTTALIVAAEWFDLDPAEFSIEPLEGLS